MTDHPQIAALVQKYARDNKVTGFGDHFLFFVGVDDVHGILMELLGDEKNMLKMNMFGYDDEDLDKVILGLIKGSTRCQITLDRSQASGVHEKTIITGDKSLLGPEWGNSFAIGQSATHQISHTKGGVCVGQNLAFEGSTNWSASGEGAGVNLQGGPNPTGFKAQNNTLVVSANSAFISRFGAELDVEHTTAIQQERKRGEVL